MLPYVAPPVWRVGPLEIHAFGVAVAAALMLGTAAVQARTRRLGLDTRLGERLGWWILLGGMIGAHLFSVLLYFPDKLRADPWLLLRLWEDISSFGGMLGGLAGALAYFATRARAMPAASRLAHLDAVAFVFPAGLAIGRLGCALAHDHPGTVTTFPLAVSLASDAAHAQLAGVYAAAGLALPPAARAMGFHDLGLYECLYLALVVVPLFLAWDRRPRPAGFYLVAFAALYLPVRFGLDLLRVADARWAGLTPAQWVAALVLAALPLVALRGRRMRHPALRAALTGLVILATAWACAAGPR